MHGRHFGWVGWVSRRTVGVAGDGERRRDAHPVAERRRGRRAPPRPRLGPLARAVLPKLKLSPRTNKHRRGTTWVGHGERWNSAQGLPCPNPHLVARVLHGAFHAVEAPAVGAVRQRPPQRATVVVRDRRGHLPPTVCVDTSQQARRCGYCCCNKGSVTWAMRR